MRITNTVAITTFALALALPAGVSAASIAVTLPTATTNGTLIISENISFTINTEVADGGLAFVLDEWLAGDGVGDKNAYQLDPSLAFKVNLFEMAFLSHVAEGASAAGWEGWADISSNDGWISFPDNVSLSIGDIVTLKSGVYDLLANPTQLGFNPGANQTFNGNMFISNSTGTRVSNIVALPEPSTAMLTIGSLASITFLRRRPGNK